MGKLITGASLTLVEITLQSEFQIVISKEHPGGADAAGPRDLDFYRHFKFIFLPPSFTIHFLSILKIL